MFRTTSHRQVALAVALVALALTGAVVGVAIGQTDASTAESSGSTAESSNSTAANATATIHHDGERLVLAPASNVTIRGETTVEPKTEIIVVVKSEGSSFVEPERTTVGEDGTFTATFDLTDLQFGTPVTVVTRTNDTVLGRETGARTSSRSDVNVTLGPADDADGPLILHSAPNQTVRVQTNASAGTELSVTLRSTRYNLLTSTQVTVSDDGSATASFDLSEVTPGATFTVTAGADADDEAEGLVVNESATVHRDATFAPADTGTNLTIRGRVMDPAVTRLDVGVAPEGETQTRNRTVAVGEDRTFEVTFDRSSLDSDAEVAVEVGGIPRSVTPVVVTEEGRAPTVYAFVETPPNATIRYPQETVLVHPAANQTVYGETNLRPGTELTVKAVRDERNSPDDFTRTANVTVGDDGRFAADLNFTGIEPGTNFSVRVDRGLATKDGRVVGESVTLPTVTTTEAATETNTPDVPGFGVPVALVALLAGLALARRA